jgi:hypothetical protein
MVVLHQVIMLLESARAGLPGTLLATTTTTIRLIWSMPPTTINLER